MTRLEIETRAGREEVMNEKCERNSSLMNSTSVASPFTTCLSPFSKNCYLAFTQLRIPTSTSLSTRLLLPSRVPYITVKIGEAGRFMTCDRFCWIYLSNGTVDSLRCAKGFNERMMCFLFRYFCNQKRCTATYRKHQSHSSHTQVSK